MTFYLKPPDGSIPTYKFETFAECRLKFLISVLNHPKESLQEILEINSISRSHLDCVIDGTAKDRVAHFALRSSLIANTLMHQMIVDGETALFVKRLQEMDLRSMELSIKNLLRHIKLYLPFLRNKFPNSKFIAYFQSIYAILSDCLSKKMLHCHRQQPRQAIKSCQIHADNCIIEVPFIHITEMIGNRQVHLVNGIANLTCFDIAEFLRTVFQRVLEFSSSAMRNSPTLIKYFGDDIRFLEISRHLRKIISASTLIGSVGEGCWRNPSRLLPINRKISLNTLDHEVCEYFPPCMRTFYTTLRTTHRLSHHSRFQFTLFLKDIGLSAEDCIALIKQEYSKPVCQSSSTSCSQSSTDSSSSSTSSLSSKCSHSWEKDKNRYIYGIRHMYGLEGARKNYSSHSCKLLVKDTSTGTCNSCPFVNCHENSTFQKNIQADLESLHHGNALAPEFLSKLKNETNLIPIESCHIYLNFKKEKVLSGSDNSKSLSSSQNQIDTTSCLNASYVASITTNSQSKSNLNHNFSKPSQFYSILKTIEDL